MFDDLLTLFEKGGWGFSEYLKNPRALSCRSDDGSLRLLLVRSSDVIAYVEYGGADMGIVGRDQIEEQNREMIEPLDLNVGFCRLVVARPGGPAREDPGRRTLRIATKYPRLAEMHFLARGIPVSILKLYGSLELAPQTGLADQIVDLVATGRTLRENDLEIVEEILPSTARLIVNRASWSLKNRAVMDLLDRLRPHIPPKPVISG
ncbi:MAG: ATP phosphoribosyltransferase [Nitrospirae bacterium]|nr:ATP phosphoribosyltransferase [Nitrospirota bacterium]MCL5285242.1 ATP phosphoribosyltransferase [Nitrospirota bacterium]